MRFLTVVSLVYLVCQQVDIQNLVKRLKNIAKELYENGITKVFVATVIERGSFPEWTGLTRPIFNKIRHALNMKLHYELGTDLENKIPQTLQQ